ncbi:thermonuclease family protein [Halotia branconii]|uniref:Thermonuclease family protein n=1 Tax=Halotia branconii CENA392 TaxID=1539056 RepID=A0AAJ6NYJ0_9CYAN|nr:thermonuclease family protein [Halotia branconii]WGV29110.1 thermonuclease family protein [Halotia branconii CENA392]
MKPLIILGILAGATTVAILTFPIINTQPISLTEEWIVREVIDGSTITVGQTDGSQMKVRLCGIDTPSGQLLGNKAKEKLRSLVVSADNEVMIIPVETDRDGYTVAEVMAYGKDEVDISFQEELLKSGLAKTRNSGVECPNQLAFGNAQKIAIASKTGMWK